MAMALIWICLSSCTNRMFHILREVAQSERLTMLDPCTLDLGPR